MNRRHFIQTTLAAAATSAPAVTAAPKGAGPFSFALLGDLHYDKLEHHDIAWIEKNKAGDLSQIQNYSRITRDLMPRLFESVRQTVTDANSSFVLHVGDLVEGLCGTEELAARQNREAVEFVRNQKLGAPFLFTKG